MSCPSQVVLDQYLLTPASVAARQHIEACSGCQARLEQMREADQRFRQYVLPATLDAAVEAAMPRPFRLPRLLWPLATLAATSAALLLLVPTAQRSPDGDYLGVKGEGLSIRVFSEAPEGAQPVVDGDRLRADARLRASVQLDSACWLWLLSIDGTGQVSRLFPLEGDGGSRVTASGPLPGGAQLDGVSGPERLIAVCSPQPLEWSLLEAAARRSFSPAGPGSVRRTRELSGLPSQSRQASILLEKAR